jgi:hypothetical protein
MKVTIQFDTDNAAFEDNPYLEVDYTLKQAKSKMSQMEAGETRRLMDGNGNTVGTITLEE